MKAKFIKIFKLFEELEEAGECATLTISSKGGTSSIKLLLESPSSLPTTASLPTTLPPVSGKRRRHRGAAARARRRQRAADHQASLLERRSSVPPPPAPGEASWTPSPHPSFTFTHIRSSVCHILGKAASAIFWQSYPGWTTPFTTTSAAIVQSVSAQRNIEHCQDFI